MGPFHFGAVRAAVPADATQGGQHRRWIRRQHDGHRVTQTEFTKAVPPRPIAATGLQQRNNSAGRPRRPTVLAPVGSSCASITGRKVSHCRRPRSGGAAGCRGGNGSMGSPRR